MLMMLGFVVPSASADDFAPYYDCSGVANGNYNHPTECDQFISCSNGTAYERDCPSCQTSEGLDKCPDGKLHYNALTDKCETADIAKCHLNEQMKTSFHWNL